MIDNFIAYLGATYIRDLTVLLFLPHISVDRAYIAITRHEIGRYAENTAAYITYVKLNKNLHEADLRNA